MCGIAGGFGIHHDPTIVHDLTTSVAHRGPDATYDWETPFCSYGVQRLAIVGIQNGAQPFFSRNLRYVVIFNGEIYNYLELRAVLQKKGYVFKTDNDGEVIPFLIEQHGTRGVNELEGMFAIAIFDRFKNELKLLRDYFGIKPLYYVKRNKQVYFCSELNGLRSRLNTSEISFLGLQSYFQKGHVSAPNTIYQEIRQVRPGECMTFDIEGSETSDWPIQISTNSIHLDLKNSAEMLQYKVRESVRLQLASEVGVGVYLSGGLDSSLIAAIAASECQTKLSTFSLVYGENMSEGKHDDAEWSKRIARTIHSNHTEVPISYLDLKNNFSEIVKLIGQPFSGVYSSFFLSRVAAQSVKVILTGDGADELFGSYVFHRLASVMDSSGEWASDEDLDFIGITRDTYLSVWSSRNENERRLKFNHLVSPAIESYVNLMRLNFHLSTPFEYNSQNFRTNIPRNINYESRLRESLEFDIGDLLPDNVLMYADRFSMRWGIEVRPPLLSRDILALARSVPTEFLISNGQTKRILREAARGILPTDLIERKKEGFLLPLDKWLRNELRNWMMTEFSESKIKSINILNYDRCSKLIDKLDFYDFRVTSLVWKLMCFQEWYSQTYD